jgi:hypothetical protein
MAITLPFIDTNVTVNQIISVFQQIAEDHAQINSFAYGQEYDFGADTIQNYPLLWVWVQPSKISNQSIKYIFRVIVFDLVNTEGTGTQQDEVQSDTINVLWDICFLLRDKYDFAITFDIDATPFTEKGNDRPSGWMMDLPIEIPQQFGICDVPLK